MFIFTDKNDRYHYVYRIISLVPGKPYYYIGKHSIDLHRPDEYLGSGQSKWKNVLKKYGEGNFIRTPVKYFHTAQEALDFEKEYIGDLYETDPWCCNLRQGGSGGRQSLESRERMSESYKGLKMPPCSEERKRKIGEANSKKTRTDEEKKRNSDWHKGIVDSEETKKRKSESIAKWWAERKLNKINKDV